jgi:hypothetical protein
MKNINLEKTIEVWSFQLNEVWFEVQLFCDNDERKIKSMFKENCEEVTDEERKIIVDWIKTIDNI